MSSKNSNKSMNHPVHGHDVNMMCSVRQPRTEHDMSILNRHCGILRKMDYNVTKTFTGVDLNNVQEYYENPQYLALKQTCGCNGGCQVQGSRKYVDAKQLPGVSVKETKEGYMNSNNLAVFSNLSGMCPKGNMVINRGVQDKGLYKL